MTDVKPRTRVCSGYCVVMLRAELDTAGAGSAAGALSWLYALRGLRAIKAAIILAKQKKALREI